MTETDEDEDEVVCGRDLDHDEVHEDRDGIVYWFCRRCGAEGWFDADA